ncbi:unnamed protein product [Durusdinium trenchii]|uniref:Uncharacterized protein n=1 Tax=Durusdinium trenchii TaxID=1381693 RepID=A0ABP0RKN8_9DINO
MMTTGKCEPLMYGMSISTFRAQMESCRNSASAQQATQHQVQSRKDFAFQVDRRAVFECQKVSKRVPKAQRPLCSLRAVRAALRALCEHSKPFKAQCHSKWCRTDALKPMP